MNHNSKYKTFVTSPSSTQPWRENRFVTANEMNYKWQRWVDGSSLGWRLTLSRAGARYYSYLQFCFTCLTNSLETEPPHLRDLNLCSRHTGARVKVSSHTQTHSLPQPLHTHILYVVYSMLYLYFTSYCYTFDAVLLLLLLYVRDSCLLHIHCC